MRSKNNWPKKINKSDRHKQIKFSQRHNSKEKMLRLINQWSKTKNYRKILVLLKRIWKRVKLNQKRLSMIWLFQIVEANS